MLNEERMTVELLEACSRLAKYTGNGDAKHSDVSDIIEG
jgi:hypothetical protein